MLLAALRDAFVLEAAIRNRVGQRIFDGRAPAGAELPYIVLTRIATQRLYDLDGELDVAVSTVQVDVWSDLADERGLLAEACRGLLSGSRGTLGSSARNVTVLASTIEREEESAEPPADASDRWTFRDSRDYRITHKRITT